MNKPYITHISFSSGGLKGFCYLGILRYLYLENMIENIKYIGGTSIGSFFAFVLGMKIPLDYVEEEILKIIHSCVNEHYISINKKSLSNMFLCNGMYKADFSTGLLKRFLKKEYDVEDITFLEYIKRTGKNIYISCTNISTSRNVVFSAETHPNLSVLTVVEASMTIPFIFEPTQINGEYYVDGGISNDLIVFDNINKDQYLGVILCANFDNIQLVEPNKQIDFFEFTKATVYTMYCNLMKQSMNKEHKNKSVLKICDIPYSDGIVFKNIDGNLDIDISDELFENLILKGFIDISNYIHSRMSI